MIISKVIGIPIRVGDVEIAQYDCPFTENCGLRWEEAVESCNNLGDGWRLPTIDELELIFHNKKSIGGFVNEAIVTYWSSTLYDDKDDSKNAWIFFFNDELGTRGYGEIGANDILGRHTRAVRSINN
jgi:hypothetical protein